MAVDPYPVSEWSAPMFDPANQANGPAHPAFARSVTRRQVLAATSALGLLPFGVARAQSGTPAATPTGEWSFTDDRGVTLSLPETPTKIVGQTAAAAALWDYGIHAVGIFGPSRTPSGIVDFQAGNIDLDAVEILGDYGEMDLEKLVALNADFYIDFAFYEGQLWYLGDTEDKVKEIVPTLGISMQKTSIVTSIERFADLAASLGADLEAPDVVQAKADFTQAEADLKAAIAAKPGLTVLVIAPTTDQVYVASPRWMTDLYYYHELGLDIVDHTTDDFFALISWEQIGEYPADLILTDARTDQLQLDKLKELATWNALPAVQAGQVGPWYAGAPYSHQRLTPILQELTGLIANANPDVV